MSSDPAKLGFSSHPRHTKFHKRKDLSLPGSTTLEFLKSDLYF